MKKKLLSLFTIMLAACAIGFMCVTGLFNAPVKAEESQTVEFEMLGASIRVGSDYAQGGTGLRFAAKVDKSLSDAIEQDRDDDYMFGGLIVPASLLTADAETGRPAYKAGENLLTYMANYHSGVNLATMENLTVGHRNAYDIVAFSLTNVANTNLARDFYGIIYIKDGSNYTFAANGVYRSVHLVSTTALADSEAGLTTTQESVVLSLAKQAAYVARVGAANVSNTEDLTKNSAVMDVTVASNYTIQANEWNETELEYAYAKTGKVNYDVIINDNQNIEEATVFNAYREYSVDVADQKYITVDKETGEIFVTDGAFDGVAESEITVNVKMRVLDAVTEVPVRITNNVSTIASEVTDALNTGANITIEDAYDGIDLHIGRYKYEELSPAGKRAVDSSVLSAFEAKEAEYEEQFSIVSGPLNYDKTSYVGGTLVTKEAVEDGDYGLVYEMQYSDQSGNGYVLIQLNTEAIFASGKKVYISMYNGGAEDAEVLYLKDRAYWTRPGIALPANAWTEVEIDSGLLSGDTIGLVASSTANNSYKFTLMYSKSESYVANQVVTLINGLPETLTGIDGAALNEARALYETLSDEGKALVGNIATLEAKEAEYAENYQLVLAMNEASGLYSNINSFGDIANYEYATEAAYGNVLVGTAKASGAAVVISDIAVADLSIAKTIYVWVYKSGTAGRFNACQGGNWNTMHSINANTWTLIEMPAADIVKYNFGFWDVKAGEIVKVSCIWAETYAPEISAMEDQISALTGEDADAIISAFDAFNALPTGVQNAVSNKDVLMGYVDTYNSTLINRAIDAINLIPASPKGEQYGLILAAKDAYSKVPNALRGEVTNYSNIAKAESAWKNNYEILLAWEDDSRFEEFEALSANMGTGIHTLGFEVIDNYGKVLKADVTTSGTLVFSYSATTNVAGLKSIVFTIYNGSSTARPLDYWASGAATGTGHSLAANAWTTFEVALDGYAGITATEIGNGYTTYTGKFGIWGATPGTWYVASVYFNTYWGDVNNVQAMIDALTPGDEDAINAAREAYEGLPEDMKSYVNTDYLEECEASLSGLRVQAVIDLIDAIPDAISAYDILKIEAARAKYEALGDADKLLVTNSADLEAAETKYDNYFVLGASASGYVDVTNGWILGNAVSAATEEDATYGPVLALTRLNVGANSAIGFMTGAAATVKDYTTAVIYVYNGGTQNVNAMQLIGGGWTALDTVIVAGQWNKVEISTANFDANYILGVTNATEIGATYKFSSMWLYTDLYAEEGLNLVRVNDAIAAIDQLPEEIKEYDKATIDAARAAVDLVAEGYRSNIINLAELEAAEEYYNTYYLVVSEAATFADATANWMGGGDAQTKVEKDEIYGNVYSLTYVHANGYNGVGISFVTEGTLADYGTFVTYIYNGGSTTAKIRYLNGAGSAWVENIEIPAGEWTKVVLDATDMNSRQLLFIVNCELNATFKISTLYAYTDAYNDILAQEAAQVAIDAIDALPETINEYSYYDIQAVQAVIDSIPSEYHTSITNLSDFEAYKAEYDANYLMVRAWTDTNGISNISANYVAGTTQALSIVDDATYGKVLKIEHTGTGAIALEYTALTTEIPEGWILMFVGYNGGSTAHPFDICQSTGSFTGVGYGGNAPVGQWFTVEINEAECTFRSETTGRVGFWGATAGTYYLAGIYAVNPSKLEGEAIQAAIDAIDAIPETLNGYDYGYILAAQEAVNAVSDAGQAQIINLAQLDEAAMNYNNKFVSVLPMNQSYGFTQDMNTGGDRANYEFVVDQDHGIILQGTVHTNGAAVLQTSSGSAPDLSMSSTVYVWVYKSGTAGNFNARQNNNWDTMIAIPADTWTLIEIPASEYTFGRFGIWGCSVGETVMFSMFWADKVTAEVNEANAAIAKIPQTIHEYDYEVILAAREAVDAVPESFRTSDYIADLARFEAAETEWNTYYEVLAPVSTFTNETANMLGGGGAASVVTDQTYGSVYAMEYTSENSHSAVMFRFGASLEGVSTFSVFVYNGGSAQANAYFVSSAGSWTTHTALPAGEWTKVTFDATNAYKNPSYGIKGAEPGATYKFSALYTYTDAYGLLQAQEAINNAEAKINAIPETLEGYHYNYILDAEVAVALVPSEYQSYIENLADLEAAKTEYDTYYVAVLPMMDASAYYEQSATFGELSTASVEYDATYGKVLVRNVHTGGAQVNYWAGGITADLTGVETVSIYVNKTTAGNFCAVAGWSPMTAVSANTWTRIDMPVASLRTDAFGMWGAAVGDTIKYTMFWADKPAKIVQPIIEQIEALPDGTSEFDYVEIEAARAAVDALDASYQNSAYIPNLSKLENVEATYASLYSLVASAAGYQDVTSGWIGGANTYGKAEDPDYGTVFTSILSTMNGNGRIAFKLKPTITVTNYPAIAMYIYNGGTADVNLMILVNDASWTGFDVLPAGEWTRVVIDTTKFGPEVIMGLINVTENNAQFMFTNAFGLTEYGLALDDIQAANDAVASMPETINAFSYYELNAIRAVVDAVPENYRTSEYISGLSDFEALEAKYDETYIMVRAWEDTTGISNVSANYSGGTTQAFSIVDDATYGKVLKIEHTGTGSLAIEYSALTTDMTSATKLYFIGFNGGSSAHPFDICQSTGSFTGVGYGGNAPVGQWFTVEINAADYTFRSATTGRVGFWNATAGTYYIAAIYAENATGAINNVIDSIEAIPADVVGESAGLIATARAQYDALGATLQAQVTNADKLIAAEEIFYADYAIVSNVNTYTYDANMGGSYANAEVIKDATYGNVFKFVRTGEGGVVFKFTPSVTITNYAKLYVAVKVSSEAYVGLNVGGWDTAYKAIEADVWTVVEITAADLSSNAIGIWGGSANMTIEYSTVWASYAEINEDLDQSDPF